MTKALLILSLLIFDVNLSQAKTSIPDLPYDKTVKEKDCFEPSNSRFPLILQIEKILVKEKAFEIKMFFDQGNGQYYVQSLGKMNWGSDKTVWKKVSCPKLK